MALTFEAAVQAAAIAGVVSVIVTLINNAFARQSRISGYKQQRRDWALERQARDAEQIIKDLDGLVRKTSELLSEVERHLVSSIFILGDENDIDKDRAQSFLGDIDVSYEKIEQNDFIYRSWFRHDTVMLTVWFDETTQSGLNLDSIGSLYRKVYLNSNSAAHKLKLISRRAVEGRYTNKDYKEIAKEAQDHIHTADKAWQELVEAAAETQRRIAQKLIET